MNSGSVLTADVGQLACIHPSSVAAEGLCPLLEGADSSGVGLVLSDVHAETEKRRTHEFETGKNTCTEGS